MVKFHSVVVGNGKPLIFLPAVGFSGIEGLNIAEALAENYECHLLDMPGMGKSAGIKGKVSKQKIASWVKEYIDQHEMKEVTLIGHSMGGGIAMCFASVYPAYVTKLILLDQGHLKIPRFPIKDFGPLGYIMPIMSTLERIFGDKFIRKMEGLFTSGDNTKPTNDKLEKQVKEFCERFKIEESDYIKKALMEEVKFTGEGLRLMFGYYRLDLPKILKGLTTPSLLIYASFKDIDDNRASMTEKAVKKINHARNVSLSKIDSHHYVHWSDEKCLIEIKNFLGCAEKAIS
ncbi:alpha/beta hydrolase [Virgibacillus necropolis]|uniref:alpha/beta hydrolase n=1 Tax=Virgibacillus necropolis TaxID=163877 RepID=UPI00384DA1CF